MRLSQITIILTTNNRHYTRITIKPLGDTAFTMKTIPLILAAFTLLTCAYATANPITNCDNDANMHLLDQRYEHAIQTSNETFLTELLTDNFSWIHTLAKNIESKSMLLTRINKPDYDRPISRVSEFKNIQRSGNTVVVSGVSSVTKHRPSSDSSGTQQRVYEYYFSRTYVQINDTCKLLSSMTMKISERNQ